MTALHLVVQTGWHSLTEGFLAKEASASTITSSGMKPLITAASRVNAKGAELLLNAGANIEARDESTLTALIHACESECNAAMQIRLEHGASIKTPPDVMTPLHIATSQDNTSGVSLLLGAGANPEAKFKGDYTPLLLAARKGNTRRVEMMRLLCERGANLSAKDSWEKSALYRAGKDSSSDKKILAEILKSHGAK